MSPAKSKTPAELLSMSDADLKRMDAHLKREVANGQRLRCEIGRERTRRRRAKKAAQP